MISPERPNLKGAIGILDNLVRNHPSREHNAVRRVMAEVVEAWPGDVSRLWFKWFREAAKSLGIRARALDCSIDQAIDLARNEARLICFRETEPGQGEWLSVQAVSRGRFQIMLDCDQRQSRPVSAAGIREALSPFVSEGHLRCVAIDTHLPQVVAELANARHRKPLDRLWQLLKPESGDIWLVVVFAFFVALLALATPVAVETLVNTVAFGRLVQPIVVLAMILLTFLAFQGAIRALQVYMVEVIQRRLFARVGGDLAYRLPRTESGAAHGQYMPELVNRFFDVVTVQKSSALLLLDGLSLTLNTFIGMAVLGFYHPWLLGFDVFLLILVGIGIFGLGRGAIGSAINESKHKYRIAAWLEDLGRCPTVFRGDGGAHFAVERGDRLMHDYLQARRKHFRVIMGQVLFALGLQAVASTALLGLGGWLVVIGELTLGQLVAAELIVTIIVGSFAKLGKHMESFYDLLAAVDKLGHLFDLPMERQDGVLIPQERRPATLSLSSVRFAWPGGISIGPIDFRAEAGERVAVYGPAGAGKSSLLDLIQGIRVCEGGDLTIDLFDPRDLRPDALGRRVALARPGIFHSTVEENIHLYREGVSISQVREALEGVGLLDPILQLPDGCATLLSSDGAPLSQTQQGLVSLARAIVGQPGLLLVDGLLDPLSGSHLEKVLDYLTHLDHPWTLLVATSRVDIAQRFEKRLDMGPRDDRERKTG